MLRNHLDIDIVNGQYNKSCINFKKSSSSIQILYPADNKKLSGRY